MIAANFRRFPEALLAQLELRLDAAAQYFQDLTPTLQGIWGRLLRQRKPAARPAAPAWFLAVIEARKALAAAVRAACLPIAEAVTV